MKRVFVLSWLGGGGLNTASMLPPLSLPSRRLVYQSSPLSLPPVVEAPGVPTHWPLRRLSPWALRVASNLGHS